VKLTCKGQSLYEKQAGLDPDQILLDSIALPIGTKPQDATLSILVGNTVLLAYTPLPDEKPEIPSPATPALPPEEIGSNEELFLNGLHLEQYRHATYLPEPYYLEALRRDPGDSRCNNAMGLLLYRRGKFAEGETYFRKAVRRLTQRNPNPYDGEPCYYMGLALKMQGRYSEAFDAFHKAVWNAAWQDAAYFELARLASRNRDFAQALDFAGRSLNRNGRHHQARHLKIALLRRMGQLDAARRESITSLELDSMEYGALWEHFLLDGDPAFENIVRPDPATYIELALDYSHAGLFDEALNLLEQALSDPLAVYTSGWVLAQSGQEQAAGSMFRRAASLPGDYCFPNRLEDVVILEAAQRANPQDARAPYYLGNFWYAHHRYDEAMACWEQSRELDPTFATVQRNLGLAYFNKRNDPQRALVCLETAYALNPADGRVFFELDQLYKRLNRTPGERLALLQHHLDLVEQRDDLTIEYITLLNLLSHADEAYQHLMQRNFHPWEGGEGKVSGQYITSLVEKAAALTATGEARQAIELLMQAQIYPHNLGEGKLYGAQDNNILYFLGCAYEVLGETENARHWFERAATGLSEPTSAMFYNDQPPDMIFYQGLARLKVGQIEKAHAIFTKLVDYGKAHLNDEVKVDYFAVSLPDFLVFDADLNQRNRQHCHYMMGLGYLGLDDLLAAKEHFEAVLALDANHLGATLHLRFSK
jgi:tetratricopeptide (TPR) repeat protein